MTLPIAFAACGYDWTVVPKGASSSSGGTGAGGLCNQGTDCASTFCSFPDHQCGDGKPTGVCTETPAVATCTSAPVEVVCTCDGQVSKTRCAASAAAKDLASDPTRCSPSLVPDRFKCGFQFCTLDTYCLDLPNSDPPDFQCVPFKCKEQNCTCSDITAKCAKPKSCESPPSGGTIVHCP